MQHPHGQRRRRLGLRATAAAGGIALVSGLCLAGGATAGLAAAARPASAGHQAAPSDCHLANGIKHVVQIGFDNVHFFRDNPNVPSDLEMLPEPAELPRGRRHAPVEQPHAADRPHRR